MIAYLPVKSQFCLSESVKKRNCTRKSSMVRTSCASEEGSLFLFNCIKCIYVYICALAFFYIGRVMNFGLL